jgi:hypothetical protein
MSATSMNCCGMSCGGCARFAQFARLAMLFASLRSASAAGVDPREV